MALLSGALAVVTAHSAPLNAVNAARMSRCVASASAAAPGTPPRTPPRTPLRYSIQLQRAAQRYSYGASLQSAIADSGYLAAQSAAIHLSGPLNDAEAESMLVAHDCRTVQAPRMREFGAVQRGRDTWMILAVPVALPARGDATSVSRVILDLLNSARAAGRQCGGRYFEPAAPLALDASLTRAALEHSHDMAQHDAFDHRGHDGSTPNVRVERAGFGPHRIVGENIAAGAMTPAEVTDGWLQSPAHCENIMDSRFTLVGIAFAENLHSRSAVFWTQDFAARR